MEMKQKSGNASPTAVWFKRFSWQRLTPVKRLTFSISFFHSVLLKHSIRPAFLPQHWINSFQCFSVPLEISGISSQMGWRGRGNTVRGRWRWKRGKEGGLTDKKLGGGKKQESFYAPSSDLSLSLSPRLRELPNGRKDKNKKEKLTRTSGESGKENKKFVDKRVWNKGLKKKEEKREKKENWETLKETIFF